MMIRTLPTLCVLGFAAANAAVCCGGAPFVTLAEERSYTELGTGAIHFLAPALSAAHDALQRDGITIRPVDRLSDDTLQGVQIVFLGLLEPTSGLSASEQLALDRFVRGGGSLVFVGDNHAFRASNESVARLFGVAYCDDLSPSFSARLLDPTHPIANGPGGPVRRVDLSGNLDRHWGAICELGPYGTAVIGTGTRTFLAVIEPGSLGAGSGGVVFISDVNWLIDPGFGTIERADNITLLRNVFAYSQWNCRTDEDCDNGLYCDGQETCHDRTCQRGPQPCAISGLVCSEATRACGPCTSSEQCGDDTPCRGAPICVSGTCIAGDLQCDSECGFCDADREECRWCVLDLNQDGFVGEDDLDAFAMCMGECYPGSAPCAAANFDQDPGGCVGSGDLSGLVSCLGTACAACSLCTGPGGAPQVAGESVANGAITTELVLRSETKGSEHIRATGRGGGRDIREGSFLDVEVWLDGDESPENLAGAYVGLEWDATRLGLESVEPGTAFRSLFVAELSEEGNSLSALGGVELRELPDVTSRIRLASLRFRLQAAGSAYVAIQPARTPYGLSIRGRFGTLPDRSLKLIRRSFRIGPREGKEGDRWRQSQGVPE